MNIKVEGTEQYGNEVYAKLFERILIDLGLTNRVEAARMIIKPEAPLFLVSIRTRQARSTVKVKEITSTLEQRGSDSYMVIAEESYAPALLAMLWKRYGRERIEQITRLELLVKGIKVAELEELELNPGHELKKDMLDAVWRLLPEGFKVRHNLFSDTVLTIAATEHVMEPEWIALAEKVHREMETAPPVEPEEAEKEEEDV
ncbi:MAG TPA: methanogenesis marker 17 protein [Methanomassiliicoccales archaeon]|nr:methanogenesis marker 17 protein [Methanomassiliicoccales archaeon]